ncbi:BCCT family transporter [Zhihengliuella flava]|uniref:Choline/glycine/proline betaine transport protein n=1 Tax=Zhihengliuella flava TaxID=1285193 RepID=A0A931D4W4_9MICC|nr:BCCT family transporter [Zhihengliuella flava]MBG6084479.1 choline/glycine/proline betaine transport protein [Zhihengliuella flava]
MSSAPSGATSHAAPRAKILKPVFWPASIVIFALLGGTVIFSQAAGDALEEATSQLNTAISDGVGWWYVIAVNIFLAFAIYFAVSKIGRIRLGRDDEQPEFGMASWFMMLFSAGMGIGLVFFSVAEPLSHYITPPYGIESESDAAINGSMGVVMLHWGLHPWAIYSIVGLGLAYMTFRRGRPLAVRWLLEPLLGRQRVEGWMGHAIDTVAIVGTLFGVATSFGFGVSQILGGLEFLGWAETSNWLIITIVAAITLVATFSVVSGVHKGLKWLSNFNMSVAALLALVIFLLGPTLFLLKAFPENLGNYLTILPETMFHSGPFSTDGWEAAWTIFYWGWWISWAPFVGMFIARISRGRTIREFIVGVLLAPTLVSLVWFTIFGDTAILFQREGTANMVTDGAVSSTTALFQFFESFPLTTLLSVIAMVVVVFFFVTSSDSGSLVIDMLASGGSTHTSTGTRIYWAVLEGAAAAILLVVGGSVALTALQTLSISTAAPFSIVLVLACISLTRAFRHDVASMPNFIEVTTPPGTDAAEVAPALGRRFFRGFGGTTTSLSGLTEDQGAGPNDGPSTQVISYRYVDPEVTSVDPATGAIHIVGESKDPLAGETFDTPEFESSQEYINQGGDPPTEATDEEAEPGRS